MVTVHNITIKVGKQTLLHSISCSLTPGRITTFIGKSGAGKTTLLKSLVGLMPVASGTITIDQHQLHTLTPREQSETIGYVFQDFNLFPNFSVAQNCLNPLIIHGIALQAAKIRVDQILAELEIQGLMNKYPSQLSGGQQQRVAIARALCLNPKVLLLDEPTASLDPINTDILVQILKRFAAQGFTIGVSSQDISFVHKIFDRIYYIEMGEIIEYCDGTELLPQSPTIQRFIQT